MEIDKKIKIIERFDNYYASINNKGAFILAINTFVISGMLIGLKDLQTMISCSEIFRFKITVGIVILFSLISMVFTICAIIPYLKSNNKSYWFFGDIANMEREKFLKDFDQHNKDFEKKDINEQIYLLSKGLTKKYNRIKIALIFNFVQMFLLGYLTYLILT